MSPISSRRYYTFKTIQILVIISICLSPIILFLAVSWQHYRYDLKHMSNLRTFGMFMKMYANDYDQGYMPPLSRKPGYLIFEEEAIGVDKIPDFIMFNYFDSQTHKPYDNDLSPAFCQEHASFYYLGYEVRNDADIAAFADAYKKRLAEGGDFIADLPVQTPEGVLKRLREGDQDPATTVLAFEGPTPYPGPYGIWPIPLSKPEMGGVVLYMDGHIEFVPYPGKWPMTEKTMAILADLESLRDAP